MRWEHPPKSGNDQFSVLFFCYAKLSFLLGSKIVFKRIKQISTIFRDPFSKEKAMIPSIKFQTT